MISFYFKKKKKANAINRFPAFIYPKEEKIDFVLEQRFGWRLGGDFIAKIKQTKNNLRIFRLTEDFLEEGTEEVKIAIQNLKNTTNLKIKKNVKDILKENILYLRAIDSKNGKKIQLEDIRKHNILCLAGKNTSRNMAHLIFGKELPIKEQEKLMLLFNNELNKNRKKYLSFFLTNFRDNNRKRISFDLTYKFLNYLYEYEQKNEKQPVLF